MVDENVLVAQEVSGAFFDTILGESTVMLKTITNSIYTRISAIMICGELVLERALSGIYPVSL